jgi:hypothetical protein
MPKLPLRSALSSHWRQEPQNLGFPWPFAVLLVAFLVGIVLR